MAPAQTRPDGHRNALSRALLSLHSAVWSRSTARGRGQRGEGALQVIIGAVILTMIVGGFIGFYLNNDRASRESATRTQAESNAVQALNRLTRDVEDATEVLRSTNKELILSKITTTGTSTTKTITYYRLSGADPNDMVLETRTDTDVPLNTSFTDNWTPETAIGRSVTDPSKFEYFTRTGASALTPDTVGRVDFTYVAKAVNGKVALKSSAALKTATGSGSGTAVTVASAPVAVDDAVSYDYNAGGANSVNVAVGNNDTCNSASPCTTQTYFAAGTPSRTGVTVSAGTSGSLVVTFGGSYTPPAAGTSHTVTFTYTLTDATGLSDTATVTITVTTPGGGGGGGGTGPTANPDYITVLAGGAARSLNLLANDTNVTGATVSPAPNPSGITTAAAGTGTYNFSAPASYGTPSGASPFTYGVSTSAGSATGTGAVYVVDAVDDSIVVPHNASTTLTLVDNDIPDAMSTLTGRSNGAGSVTTGTISLNNGVTATYNASTGTVTFTSNGSNSAFASAGSFTYTMTQGGVSDTATVTVSVSAPPCTSNCAAVAPLNVTAYPSQTMSASTTSGTNLITWNATTGPYRVERSTNGSTYSLLASGLTGTSYTDNSIPLGTKYTYRVTDSQSTPQAGTNASLQFPPGTTTSAVGSDSNPNDTNRLPDFLGSNQVTWTAPSAANYSTVVYDLRKYRSTLSTATNSAAINFGSRTSTTISPSTTGRCSGVASGCYVDNGQTAGSETLYQVVAYTNCDPDLPAGSVTRVSGGNQCGSPDHYGDPTNYTSAAKAFQAPTLAPSSVTGGSTTADSCTGVGAATLGDIPNTADNGYYNCNTNDATLSWSANPDHGQPADAQFCDYNGFNYCSTRYGKGDANGSTPTASDVASNANVQPFPLTQTAPVAPSNWGVKNVWGVAPCNPGGCGANIGTKTIYGFPGPFAMQRVDQPENSRGSYNRNWYKPDCWDGANANGCNDEVQAAEFRPNWSASAGSDGYDASAVAIAGAAATGSRASRNWSVVGGATSPGITGSTTPGYQPTFDSSVYRITVNAWVRKGTAGAAFRRIEPTFGTAPTAPAYVQDTPMCRDAQNTKYKYAVQWRWQALDDLGGGTNGSIDGMRGFVWEGNLPISDLAVIGERAGVNWLQTPGAFPGGATWSAGDRFWNNFENNSPSTFSASNTQKTILGGNDTNNEMPVDGSGTRQNLGHTRWETYTLASHFNPDFYDGTTFDSQAYGGRYGSRSTRARATAVPGSAIDACNHAAGDNYQANGGSAWWAVANGSYVTRRANRDLGASSLTSPATQRWNAVPNYP